MGSALGNSTVLPMGTASTCGVNVLFFWSILALTACALTRVPGSVFVLFSQITTFDGCRGLPRLSFASWIEILPRNVAASARLTERLKQIAKREVIVIVQTVSDSEIVGSCLAHFESRDYVRSEQIHHVPRIVLVFGHSPCDQICVPIVLLPAIEVKRESLGRYIAELN